jgi:DNA-binding NtrC family response regulator
MKPVRSDFGVYAPAGSTMGASDAAAKVSMVPVDADEWASDPAGIPGKVRGTIRVLVIDDDRTLREGCASLLQVEGYNVTTCGRGDEAIELVRRAPFDIVIVDLFMTPVSGMEILRATLAARAETIVLMMTGNPSVASSVEALRLGAWDYLPKPFSATHLQLLFGRAAHAVIERRAKETARESMLENNGNSDKLTLLGTSPAFRRAVDLARKVASTDASVMLVGESGTGKELIAQFIHAHSRRSSRSMVPVNCAAMPEQLLESEMFGHRKGAFTGADRDKTGLLEMANGGTFFLDELTEMPLPLQAKLLRVIQDGVVRRVGSEHQDAVVDVRFVSATNRDPREAIKAKQMREDFYYRLNVVRITLPPLRERVEDIPILANNFLIQFWNRHHSSRDPLPRFSDAMIEFLKTRPWRGNVRELQNVIEHLVVFAQAGSQIDLEHLPMDEEWARGPAVEGNVGSLAPAILDNAYHLAKEQVLANFEEEYVTRLVARASGNVSRAARLASVDRTTLYRLLQRHGFRRDANDASLP